FDVRLDKDALTRTLTALVERHESLRTRYFVAAGEPRQAILDRLEVALREGVLSDASSARERTQAIIDEEAAAPFHPAAPPLFRFTLIRQPAGGDVLITVMHHIVSDGWSRNVFHRELSALYDAFRQGQSNPLAPLQLQYKDYSAWEAERGF